MSRLDDLLLLERAGELPAKLQADLDLLRAAGEVPPKAGQEEPAAAPVQRETPAEPYDPSFLGTLGREISGGASDVAEGVKRATTFSMSEPQNQGMGLLQAASGVSRAVMSPVTATGAAVGEMSGEAVRSATEGALGPTGSAIAGTAVGAPLNALTQIYGIPQLIKRAAPVVTQAAQAVARSLPGAQVALREIGKKVVEALPAMMKPARPSAEIYADLEKLNPKVSLPLFQKNARQVAGREARLAEFGIANQQTASTAGKMIQGTSETINPTAKWLGDEFGLDATTQLRDLPFDLVRDIRQRLGEHVGTLRASGDTVQLGAFKQLFKNLSSDLEQSANQNTGQAFKLLKEANTAANREFALGELDDIFNATLGRAREGAEFTSSNFAQALNKIRDLRRSDELFAKGMGAENLNKIEARLDELRKLKVLPPPKGQNVGSALVATRVAAGSGLGFSIGTLIGGPQVGAVVGGAGGFLGAVGPPVISRIVQSERGTKALIKTLEAEGTISAAKLGAIFAVIQGERAIKDDIAGKVKSALKSPTLSIDEKIQAAMQKDVIFRQASEAEVLLNQ